MPVFGALDHRAGFNTGSLLARVIRAIAANFALLEPSVRVSAAGNYQPVLGDRLISRTNAGAQTLTIPANATTAFPIGHEIKVEQTGAGALTLVAAGGVTINLLATKTLVLAGRYGIARLVKIGTNVWNASGDLTAAA